MTPSPFPQLDYPDISAGLDSGRADIAAVTPLTPALSPWEREQVAIVEGTSTLPWGEGQGEGRFPRYVYNHLRTRRL